MAPKVASITKPKATSSSSSTKAATIDLVNHDGDMFVFVDFTALYYMILPPLGTAPSSPLIIRPLFDFGENVEMVLTAELYNRVNCLGVFQSIDHRNGVRRIWIVNYRTLQVIQVKPSPPPLPSSPTLSLSASSSPPLFSHMRITSATRRYIRTATTGYPNESLYIDCVTGYAYGPLRADDNLMGQVNTGTERGPAKHVDATSVREILRGILPLPPGVINISLSYMGATLRATDALLVPQLVHVATSMGVPFQVRWPSSISLSPRPMESRRVAAMESLRYAAPRRIIGSFPANPWAVCMSFDTLPRPSTMEQATGILLVSPSLRLIHLPSSTIIPLPFTWFLHHQSAAGSGPGGMLGGHGKKKRQGSKKDGGNGNGNGNGGETKKRDERTDEEIKAIQVFEDAKRWHPNVLSYLHMWFSVDGHYLYYPSCHRDAQSAAMTIALRQSVGDGGSFPSIDLSTVAVTTERIDLYHIIRETTSDNNPFAATLNLPIPTPSAVPITKDGELNGIPQQTIPIVAAATTCTPATGRYWYARPRDPATFNGLLGQVTYQNQSQANLMVREGMNGSGVQRIVQMSYDSRRYICVDYNHHIYLVEAPGAVASLAQDHDDDGKKVTIDAATYTGVNRPHRYVVTIAPHQSLTAERLGYFSKSDYSNQSWRGQAAGYNPRMNPSILCVFVSQEWRASLP